MRKSLTEYSLRESEINEKNAMKTERMGIQTGKNNKRIECGGNITIPQRNKVCPVNPTPLDPAQLNLTQLNSTQFNS